MSAPHEQGALGPESTAKPGDLQFESTWETKRTITHEEAREIARRLIASHFRRTDCETARAGIPARPDYDDDLLINSYIKQQARKDAALSASAPASGAERMTATTTAISARSLAGMLRSRIERAAEHKSETVSLGQFFADQIHRYLTEAGYGPEHDARAGDVPADDGDPDRDRGRDWGLRARQVHLEGLSRRAADGKWFASTNGADGLARIDNGTDAMFPVRCEWHEAEFIEALVNAYRRGDLTTPAPATPPGVPDSVREAVARLDEIRAEESESFQNGGGLRLYRIIPQQSRAEALALEYVRTLLATHPAGQSAGSGAGLRLVPEQPTEAMLNAPLPAGSSITGARYESRRDLRPLIYAAMIGAAPDSTRTGDEGTELAAGGFYWVWPVLDPDTDQEWWNGPMPARYAGEGKWFYLDHEGPSDWPVRGVGQRINDPDAARPAAPEAQ